MFLYLAWIALLCFVLFPFFLHFSARVFRVHGIIPIRSYRASWLILFLVAGVLVVSLLLRHLGAPGSSFSLMALIFLGFTLAVIHKRMNATVPRALGVMFLTLFLVGWADYLHSRYVAMALTFGSLSMHPAIHMGETLYVDRLAYSDAAPIHDDLVVYESPDRDMGLNLHRVAALAGDTVAVRSGQLYVDDSLVLRITGSHVSGVDNQDVEDFGPETVPEGHVFVLADNLVLGKEDSRAVGPVPLENILGRAEAVLWSWDETGNTPVFSRMGASLVPAADR